MTVILIGIGANLAPDGYTTPETGVRSGHRLPARQGHCRHSDFDLVRDGAGAGF